MLSSRMSFPRVIYSPLIALFIFSVAGGSLPAAEYPPPNSGDFTLHDFHFRSGEVLPQLRIHYRTFGSPKRDANGSVGNAVLILHGTTGTGNQFVRAEFAGELFGKGQLLDAERYFI